MQKKEDNEKILLKNWKDQKAIKRSKLENSMQKYSRKNGENKLKWKKVIIVVRKMTNRETINIEVWNKDKDKI